MSDSPSGSTSPWRLEPAGEQKTWKQRGRSLFKVTAIGNPMKHTTWWQPLLSGPILPLLHGQILYRASLRITHRSPGSPRHHAFSALPTQFPVQIEASPAPFMMARLAITLFGTPISLFSGAFIMKGYNGEG